jgi:hypothetical protein
VFLFVCVQSILAGSRIGHFHDGAVPPGLITKTVETGRIFHHGISRCRELGS